MRNRDQKIATLNAEFDVVIVGGGINGAVSAAALVAHGVKVALLEANDFASMTSQESSNMVWGGIKYLQDFEFHLVWSLCKSRNQLLKKYPNRIKEIPFFAVVGETSPFSRNLGMLGSAAYWFFGRFKTQMPKVFSNEKIRRINSLVNVSSSKGAVQYNDAILLDNDSRFVYEFIKTAEKLGATALNYFEVTDAAKTNSGWEVTGTDKIGGGSHSLKAKVLVNAAGPYTKILNDSFSIPTANEIVISKGVHLIVPHIETNGKVLTFFDDSGRLFYVLPMHDRTVIGTTDTFASDAKEKVTDGDRDFLLAQANRCLNLPKPLTRDDIIAERCGVRPLVVKDAASLDNVDWISLSRKHVVEAHKDLNSISIYGGKLTDCINVGLEVVALAKKLGISIHPAKEWIGETDPTIPAGLIQKVTEFHGEAGPQVARELWRRHGRDALEIVDVWNEDSNAARLVFKGLGFTYGEIEFISKHENVFFTEDLLRRRTPIALLRSPEELIAAGLADFI
ncbi:MAG: hypothetical protein RLZZ330_229 [Actinomycetota bacterium]|jgi:glycerol-3-phosphate dehydrogenase